MGEVDDILDEYGLKREQAKRYIIAITTSNQKEAAEAVGVTPETINRSFKRRFVAMTAYERATVISLLAEEYRRELDEWPD